MVREKASKALDLDGKSVTQAIAVLRQAFDVASGRGYRRIRIEEFDSSYSDHRNLYRR